MARARSLSRTISKSRNHIMLSVLALLTIVVVSYTIISNAHIVAQYSGTASGTTETFSTSSDKWRFRWSCTAEPHEEESISIVLQGRDGDFSYELHPQRCPISSRTSTIDLHGSFFFTVNETNVEKWRITVEE